MLDSPFPSFVSVISEPLEGFSKANTDAFKVFIGDRFSTIVKVCGSSEQWCAMDGLPACPGKQRLLKEVEGLTFWMICVNGEAINVENGLQKAACNQRPENCQLNHSGERLDKLREGLLDGSAAVLPRPA